MKKIDIENTDALYELIYALATKHSLISKNQFERLCNYTLKKLVNENDTIRPADDNGKPGGIVLLNKEIETIIIPDVHARIEFLLDILNFVTEDGLTVYKRLVESSIQILFVGDGMHAEHRAVSRWRLAHNEYINGYREHSAMDEEMHESLGVMQIIFLLKSRFTNLVHYLKGNHDNIGNEKGHGNFPFMKFALEGPMVTEYMKKFYSTSLFQTFYKIEKNFPLFAMGKNFLVSHAEPLTFYTPLEILNYRNYPELVVGLTWTDNNSSALGTVEQMIRQYIRPEFQRFAYYFGGHRAVKGFYKLRAGGRYVQFHNPDKDIIAYIKSGQAINLNEDIIDLKETKVSERRVVS
jgi:hypothetical protein